MRTARQRIIAAIGLIVLVLVLALLKSGFACPACGGRIVKTATVTDDTNAPSKNLCFWNRSVCANLLYWPDSLICTRCWLAHSDLVGNWERASESPASFLRPLSSTIRGVPLPPPSSIHSRAVFTQSYGKKRFAESLAFWCVDNENLLAGLRGYCATNHLKFSAETNRLAGQAYVKIE